MIKINKRSIGVSILLSIITLGIYGIYWMYLLVKNNRSINKNTDSCLGEMLCIIFVPFYSLYWWYTRGERLKQSFNEHNYTATSNGVVFLILAIFCLDIVSMAIMQNDFNSLRTETRTEQKEIKNSVSDKTLMWVSRITVIIIAVIAYILALDPNSSVMGLVSYAWSGLGAAFGPAILLSLFWKRMTIQGAVAGMIAGGGSVILWEAFFGWTGIYSLLPAFVIALAAVVVGSLASKQPEGIDEMFEKAKVTKL